ncbi:DUF2130 domain-containing protein [Candidatus Microgenomates bacterium]|nr:MAG: DUF2130 domain-containing protein [Candidatus Microgenomates bacterium]
MPDTTIDCPHCHQQISLDEVLTHQIQSKFKADFEAELKKQKLRFEERLQKEKQEMWKVAQEKAIEKIKSQSDLELKSLKDDLEDERKKRLLAEQTELELRKQKNKLDEEKRTFELEKQRQLDESRNKMREEITKILSEEHQHKDAENKKVIDDLKKALEEAQRKAQQGSQQLQGEVLELELEEILKSEFPLDEIMPVGKGITGADVIQKVYSRNGKLCGSITWESKRTKAWSDGWIQKLKDDQRAAKSDIAVLISIILPQNISVFGYKDGIYVAGFETVIPLASMLRKTLIQLAETKQSQVGKNEKMVILYSYLTGPEFKGRVEAILETFTTMRLQLEREKRAYTKIWAEREKQIERVINSTIGMHGDLKGLMGTSLPEIKSLDLPDNETDTLIDG